MQLSLFNIPPTRREMIRFDWQGWPFAVRPCPRCGGVDCERCVAGWQIFGERIPGDVHFMIPPPVVRDLLREWIRYGWKPWEKEDAKR